MGEWGVNITRSRYLNVEDDTKISNATDVYGLQRDFPTTGGTMEELFTGILFLSGEAINDTTQILSDTEVGVHKLSSYEYIILISTPVIVILGTLGNGLSGMVMLRKRFRGQSTSVYLIALAFSDTTFLYANSMTKNFIKVLFRFNYSTTYAHSCALYVYLLLVSKCLSAWFIVAVTSERLIVVSSPLAGRILATRRRAIISVLIITITVSAMYSFVLPSFVSQTEEDGKIGCGMRSSYKASSVDIILKVFDMVIYSILPSVILFSCNVVLVYKVIQSSKFRNRSSSTRFTMSKKRKLSQSKRLTMTLLLLSCVYLILTFPMTAFLCYVASVETVHNYQVIFRSLYTLQLTNSALNFLLYTSGPAFREELRRVFCVCGREDPSRNKRLSVITETSPVYELPSPTSIITVC